MKRRLEYLKKLEQTILSVITTPKNKICAAGQLCFLELGRFLRFHTTWYFSKLLDLKAAAKAQSTRALMAVTRCQDHSAQVLHHLAQNPRTHLQPKKTQTLTQASALKSLFSEPGNLGEGQRRWKLRSSARDTYCIFRMEDVRCRRIIYYNNFTQLTAQSTQILHVIPSVENTGFSKEPCPEHTPAIQ